MVYDECCICDDKHGLLIELGVVFVVLPQIWPKKQGGGYRPLPLVCLHPAEEKIAASTPIRGMAISWEEKMLRLKRKCVA